VERLGDEARRIGEIEQPSIGTKTLHQLGVFQNDGDRAQCHGEAARAGGFLPQNAEFERYALIGDSTL
jgi:hypothetical protein